MPAATWLLHNHRPSIEVELPTHRGRANLVRRLMADSGAGSKLAAFQLLLDEQDCVQCGGITMGQVLLGGAYVGAFRLFLVEVCVPQLAFSEPVPAVGIPQPPAGFDDIAGFNFLNRFSYGNFGNFASFGLDVPPLP